MCCEWVHFRNGLLWCLLALSWGVAIRAAEANGPPAFVPGELIVKFKSTSRAGEAVARATGAEPVPDEVTALARRLSASLGVPLGAVRITSGRELLLKVDRERLTEAFVQRVGRDPSVRGVAPAGAGKTTLPSGQLEFVVDLVPGSEARRRLQQAIRAGGESAPGIRELGTRLAAGAYPIPTARIDDRGRLVLALDIAALTHELVERLNRRPDVEYAQLNRILRPLGGSGPRPQ